MKKTLPVPLSCFVYNAVTLKGPFIKTMFSRHGRQVPFNFIFPRWTKHLLNSSPCFYEERRFLCGAAQKAAPEQSGGGGAGESGRGPAKAPSRGGGGLGAA